MAVTATRKTTIVFTEDVTGTHIISAASNTDSPAQIDIVTLASGANTITVPTGGTVPTAVTIIPPVANDTSITLKGISGDTGIRLHNTDPTTVALDDSVATFVLTTGAQIIGVRFYWS